MSSQKLSIKRHPTLNLEKYYSYYLYEPELKKRHMEALPTEEMYRFFPSESDIIIIQKNPKDNYRFIFSGMKKTDFEKQKLSEFYKYLDEKMKKNGLEKFLPDWWIETDTMRYLQASNYDFKKVYELIDENIKNTEKSVVNIDQRIRYILNSGLIYMHGRDCHFRPIIVVEAEKANDLLDKLEYTLEEILTTLVYFMNYIVNYMLIPGQVENWFLICDLNNVGLSKLFLFKKIFSTLSKFRGRVIKNYLLNLSSFLRVSAKGILNILGSSAKKLVVVEKSNFNIIQEFILPENLQKKHGGTATDLIPGFNNLFPPNVPSSFYTKASENINIVTPEIYKQMCLESKPFKPFIICEYYIKLWEKEKEEEEEKKQIQLKIQKSRNMIFREFEKAVYLAKFDKNKYKKYEPPKIIEKNIFTNFFNGFKCQE